MPVRSCSMRASGRSTRARRLTPAAAATFPGRSTCRTGRCSPLTGRSCLRTSCERCSTASASTSTDRPSPTATAPSRPPPSHMRSSSPAAHGRCSTTAPGTNGGTERTRRCKPAAERRVLLSDRIRADLIVVLRRLTHASLLLALAGLAPGCGFGSSAPQTADLPLPSPCTAPEYPAPDPNRPRYTLHIAVDPVAHAVTGTVRVAFTPDMATHTIDFRLWANGPVPRSRGGNLTTGQVTVNGHPAKY